MKIKKKNTTIPINGKIVDTENVEDKTSNGPSLRLAEEMTKDIYSTKEQVIGTWIDGKTIYRKVYHIDTVAGCIAALNLIINKRVNKYLFFTMCVTYFAILFVALFLRSSIERVFIFNPLTGLIDTFSNWEMAIQSIMNLAVFIPMGYFVRKLKYSNLFIFSIVISLAIELIQVATMRGFFDVFDILLYFIGIHIGYFIFKKWQIIVE